ncbi:uncharacterized protein AMSG_08059 [Thecamonas trahens ATCC 50062]|uniref:Uncharacterized protein n=1 Tax=Thecamonas trahens ATCC 50062 TaxID=461836 RepID=A0A0L0DM78_THETB|nr:hypothetical protein AMSG_08059 [Thecamonas trahens ATCC 50062]KNC52498.1 hypothetical protein AMSG_08059 [Thecamonas trahens ATCC 50062]|eukprot:XP_013755294.1 hypothetical protein AMSG_08059 [Thecamonas trahens ATCC 50062]
MHKLVTLGPCLEETAAPSPGYEPQAGAVAAATVKALVAPWVALDELVDRRLPTGVSAALAAISGAKLAVLAAPSTWALKDPALPHELHRLGLSRCPAPLRGRYIPTGVSFHEPLQLKAAAGRAALLSAVVAGPSHDASAREDLAAVAATCMAYCLKRKRDLLVSEPPTTATAGLSWEEAFRRVFDADGFAPKFAQLGLRLITGPRAAMTAAALQATRPFVWATSTGDGDAETLLALRAGLGGCPGAVLTLAADGESLVVSPDPGAVGHIYAWSRALAHRAVLDGSALLGRFALLLHKILALVVSRKLEGGLTMAAAGLDAPEKAVQLRLVAEVARHFAAALYSDRKLGALVQGKPVPESEPEPIPPLYPEPEGSKPQSDADIAMAASTADGGDDGILLDDGDAELADLLGDDLMLDGESAAGGGDDIDIDVDNLLLLDDDDGADGGSATGSNVQQLHPGMAGDEADLELLGDDISDLNELLAEAGRQLDGVTDASVGDVDDDVNGFQLSSDDDDEYLGYGGGAE